MQNVTKWAIFWTALKLGLTSFGGPTAHLGYFHHTYVERKKWMTDKQYAELVALAQFLPGPASSQIGIGIGLAKGGVVGGILSFVGFTLPSVVLLMIFAQFVGGNGSFGWIQGLKLVAVAIVIHAIVGMAKNFTTERGTQIIALVSMAAVLLIDVGWMQIAVIVGSGVAGFFLLAKPAVSQKVVTERFPITKKVGAACLVIYGGLLAGLPILQQFITSQWLDLVDRFYRAGALVFGGGHVVLPLLEKEFVTTGAVTSEAFVAGYGFTQAVPGPLFTFASYVGTVIAGVPGGIVATVAIFLPAFLLIIGCLPFWFELTQSELLGAAMKGMNAAVVGILLATLYDPLWVSTVTTAGDFIVVALLVAALLFWKLPSWSIVFIGLVIGLMFYS